MDFSKDEFTQSFISEITDHLDNIDNEIINLKNSPEDKQTLASILRLLHTIKGTSRMLGYNTIEKISHGLEDVFKGIREQKYPVTDGIIKLTFTTSDCIRKILDSLSKTGSDEYDINLYLEILEKASRGLFLSAEALDESGILTNRSNLPFDYNTENERIENISSVRININYINNIIRYMDTLVIRQLNVRRQLEKHMGKVPKQVEEDLTLLENTIFDTQHMIFDMRMLPLEMILNPLKKQIETEAINLGKNIAFEIPKADFMLDKIILESLNDILIHIVRNSIDHGIESPEERKSKGKNEKGNISIKVNRISNHLEINIQDDGRGIQFENIRQKAIKIYPAIQKEISTMSKNELQQFIFAPGFTTNEHTSELSGRGVGLDIVRTNIEKIKGKIHVNSEDGMGTCFTVIIPLSLATQHGLFIHSGNLKFMLPSHYITEIPDTESLSFTTMQSQTYMNYKGKLISVHNLSSILNEKYGEEIEDKNSTLIVVEYFETYMGINVNSIEQCDNVIVNPLPRIMQNMNMFQGIVYDDNYKIIPILNIPSILQKLKNLRTYDIKKYKVLHDDKRTKNILIVDDSDTSRSIMQSIFETNGYHVETAVDGIEALDKIHNRPVDCIITDIAMPRMDGNILLKNIRTMEQFDTIPIIVISGVYDQAAKEMFMEAGAQAFIVKSEFQRGNLLNCVKELLND